MRKTKQAIREEVWETMEQEKVGRFPFPLRGRIPNFKGAEAAARHVFSLDVYKDAKVVKVNPDSPQLPIRAQVLKDKKTLLIPTPRLKDGFVMINPAYVPSGEERKAASLKHMNSYGKVVPLDALPPIDVLIVGSVALHRDGRRLGKGEGYADREYAILRELGNPEIPVIGTVNNVQLVDEDLPRDEYDLVVDYIATESEVFATHSPYDKPRGIVWDEVTDEDKKEMKVLEEIWKITKG
ncbi:5-formyltetrahydrofolate cyclo-ligase [Alteribacter aurantiacus]|uniref:5-formyltetrahydrofolate cyclo-ligase n=1 Tax=Alteribacter aurantiacus TaxID=254410 RepID=UPI00041E0CC1|nr:5-formyltetrahydrofolate cyclo-ligase [Alteribacter aurantiacus]